MFPTRVQCAKKNLLLCFDAFGTLFKPNTPIPRAYAQAAFRHNIIRDESRNPELTFAKDFKRAFKEATTTNPNYGKATGLGAEKWWSNVIQSTVQRWLEPGQEVPQALVDELLTRYSTKEGYELFPDVKPFFQMLKDKSSSSVDKPWPWEKTIVGIITNSDARVPGVLDSFGLKVGPRRVGTPDQRTAEAASEDDISFVVLSYDVGVEKPNQDIFDAAVASCTETLTGRNDGLKMNDFEKLYVGDTLENDYFGAKRAGWDALLIDREEKYKKAFEKKNKDLIGASVKHKNGHRFARVGMINKLETISDWSYRFGNQSTGSNGSEETANSSSPR